SDDNGGEIVGGRVHTGVVDVGQLEQGTVETFQEFSVQFLAADAGSLVPALEFVEDVLVQVGRVLERGAPDQVNGAVLAVVPLDDQLIGLRGGGHDGPGMIGGQISTKCWHY